MYSNVLFVVISYYIHSSLAGTVSTELLSKLKNGEKVNAILELPSVFDKVMSNPALSLLSGNGKSNMMEILMKQATSSSQAPLLSAIKGFGISATPFWITNDICLNNVDLKAVQSLGALPGVFNIREELIPLLDPVVVQPARTKRVAFDEYTKKYPHWGVNKIEAPAAWSKTKGENVIVAIIDSGVFLEHEALKDGYAGWFDAVENATNPIDSTAHGSHALGTILGRTNNIGVAPRAKWIACRAFNKDGGQERWIKSCAQWVFQQRPRVVSNSWGTASRSSTGYDDMIRTWRAANIIPVFSSGNLGGNCSSIRYPGNYADVISVGSTTKSDAISGFSSRGPSTRTPMNKPDISAPGEWIISVGQDDTKDYTAMSGTSMACPHVAGVVALLLSANPTWKYDDVLAALTRTADRPSVTTKCGETPVNGYPNYAYGYGRVNAKRAVGL
ncbi:thermitase [Folsomia candida]|uniref:Bacillopeptidase F n=1 Tax=Folsomia candida TaxID=158441 RepID=A0A226DP53_FOLCA|nr:thermitase [Folsomia candida]OXA46989.1 Bacillopeptidase F [Folsomia candida]